MVALVKEQWSPRNRCVKKGHATLSIHSSGRRTAELLTDNAAYKNRSVKKGHAKLSIQSSGKRKAELRADNAA